MIFCIYSFHASAQDVMHLTINSRSIGEITIGPTPAIVEAVRSKYKNAKKVELEYRQSMPVAAYKRTLEITDTDEKQICTINESATKPGYYTINSSTTLKKLLKEKVIKVFLLQNPRNERMAMPSRRSLLIEVHMK